MENNQQKSDSPLTDAAEYSYTDQDGIEQYVVKSDFARTIERSLAERTEESDELVERFRKEIKQRQETQKANALIDAKILATRTAQRDTALAKLAERTEERDEAIELNQLYHKTRTEHRLFAKNAQAQRDEWINLAKETGEAWEQLAACWPQLQIDFDDQIVAAQFIVSEYEKVKSERDTALAKLVKCREALEWVAESRSGHASTLARQALEETK
jgi:hypothetical protein